MSSKIQYRLRVTRNNKGFSQEYMADCLGISQRQYSRLENGESEMTLPFLEKICKELGINPEDIFADEIKQDNHNQSGGFANSAYLIVNEFSEKLIEQYENRIKDKDSEIVFLRSLLDKKDSSDLS
jgi:transcriptional regulator with XRE-family HTH domain